MNINDLFPIPDEKDTEALCEWFVLCEKFGEENNKIEIKQEAWTALQHITNEHFRNKYRMSLSSRLKALQRD